MASSVSKYVTSYFYGYKIGKDEIMKDNIIKIYQRWVIKHPELLKEKYITLLVEGLGNYKGKSNSYAKKENLHSLGRLGAELGIFNNGKLIYSTKNASTLPDIPMDPYGRFNESTPTPTLCVGVYPMYTKMHGRKKTYPAFELGLGAESVPVIRNSINFIEYKHCSNGIDFHYTSGNDGEKWAKTNFDKSLTVDKIPPAPKSTPKSQFSSSFPFSSKLFTNSFFKFNRLV